MNLNVNTYFTEGCGRCPLGGTPQCKVHNWDEELIILRKIILETGLSEESKWGVPTYTFQNNNILILSAFKEYCAISFFKGALLSDEKGLLKKPGENSQAAKLFRFNSKEQIIELTSFIKAYIFEAIEIEKIGLKIAYKNITEYEIPEELLAKFEESPELKTAFKTLTSSKQKGYLLHFNSTKQAKTREARIVKCMPKIFNGKGLNEY